LRLKRRRGGIYGQTTKGTARKKASKSCIGKGAGILWEEEYTPQRRTPTRERIDNEGDGGNVYGLWRMQRQGDTDLQKSGTRILS